MHPKNTEFTAGGSTGGEGTLLALQGTVVGWGTDIGGSIRIPSHMLGLYGLKPSVSLPSSWLYSGGTDLGCHQAPTPRKIKTVPSDVVMTDIRKEYTSTLPRCFGVDRRAGTCPFGYRPYE